MYIYILLCIYIYTIMYYYVYITKKIVKDANLDQIYLSSNMSELDFLVAHMTYLNLTYLKNVHQLKQNSDKSKLSICSLNIL